MLQKLLHQLKDLPNTTKALIGFVTTLITFIILFRKNFALGIVIFAAIFLVALFTACLGVVLAKTDPGAGFSRRKSTYKFPRYRYWAIAGMVVILLVPALLFVARPSRYYILAALKGTKVVPRADILIAQFESKHASKTYEIPNRLKANLVSELHNHQLDQVKVETLAEAITSPEEARTAAEQGDSKVVVWGEYDDLGITMKLYSAEPKLAGDDTLSMKEVSWSGADSGDSSLSFKVREQLPDNTTFLSLFVIGQLYYLDNEYQKGHQAFDAAMTNLPKEISLENESVLHFFTARAVEAKADKDDAKVICEYAKAIELNPRFAAAYNNLGIFIAKLRIAFDALPESRLETGPGFQFPEGSQPCLEKVGYDPYERNYFFDKALELLPGSAVVQYNKFASDWRLVTVDGFTNEEKAKVLADIIKNDPTIPGAHVMLGMVSLKEQEPEQNARFDEANYRTAIKEFTAAAELLPRSAELHINIGKAHQRKGHLAEAKAAFEKALTVARDNVEARLALADLALKQGQADTALQQLNSINSDKPEDRYVLRTAAILKARVQFQKNDAAAAIETLQANIKQVPEPTPEPLPPNASRYEIEEYRTPRVNYNDTSLSQYLIGLMQSLNSNQAAAAAAWKKCDLPNDYEFSGPDLKAYQDNDTVRFVWGAVLIMCASPQGEDPDISTWGAANACLPQDPRARLEKIFDLVQDAIVHRVYFRQQIEFGGLACPYVFTFDPQTNDWQFYTTIIYGLNHQSREALQARPLGNFDGRLILREVEPEVSYLDQIAVVVVDSAGTSHVLRSQVKLLERADGQYLVLRRGDAVELSFAGFDRIHAPQHFSIEAKGYYVPLSGSAGLRAVEPLR